MRFCTKKLDHSDWTLVTLYNVAFPRICTHKEKEREVNTHVHRRRRRRILDTLMMMMKMMMGQRVQRAHFDGFRCPIVATALWMH